MRAATATALRRWAAPVWVGLALAVGCSWGHQQPSGTGRPVVFPGEARLGASVAMSIDSNYIPSVFGDMLESHDLHRDRIRVLVEDTVSPSVLVPATVRSVFPVHADPASELALTSPGAWVLLALFDLPTDAEMSLSTFPAYRKVYFEVDGVLYNAPGIIKILGVNGEPTALDSSPLFPSVEDTLETRTLLRLRARWADGSIEGFDPEWEIAGVSLRLRFDPQCLASPAAFAGSEAVGATVVVGPAQTDSGGFDAAPLVLVDPAGFVLIAPGNLDGTIGGEGPFIDVAFERTALTTCTAPLEEYVELHDLVVTDVDGATLLDLTGSLGPDSSRYFILRTIDPERPL